ncbi:hypothetical protein KIN34_11005 [Cellulomonas sp. DKR-3]|uniref:Integral membrane protein n=1 Tax=Cellulomonas fulva TaxID=2835530 RepID=A0ABS5U087_9CELL|nr:hypothetical protein [Cellulomonas fulva]MBT0994809.1 hypothetical protein [Cellulomonas fulva]
MDRPTSGAARLLRAALLASLVVVLAAAAHTAAGGLVPSVLALAGLAALVLPVAVVVTGRRVGPCGALALLGLGQLVLHEGFVLLERCDASLTSSAPTGSALAGSALTTSALVGGPHTGHAAVGHVHGCAAHVGAHTSTTMLAAHAAATVATALLVAGAERGLWRVLAYLAPLLGPVLPVVVPAWPASAVVPVRPAPPVALHLRVPPARRGPPVPMAPRYPFALAA